MQCVHERSIHVIFMCALAPYEPFHDDVHVVQDSNRCLGGADQAAKTVV